MAMVKYYTIGIFTNSPHPFRKTVVQKHNPLQRLAYLALLAFISPLIWVSGLLYLFYGDWGRLGLDAHLSLEWVAVAHTLGAFMMTAFFFIHVYLTTTGHIDLRPHQGDDHRLGRGRGTSLRRNRSHSLRDFSAGPGPAIFLPRLQPGGAAWMPRVIILRRPGRGQALSAPALTWPRRR